MLNQMSATCTASCQHRAVSSTTAQDLLHAAEAYVEAGLSIIPTGTTGAYAKHPDYRALKKTGHVYWDEASREYRVTWNELRERQPTSKELHAWFITHHSAGMSLVTGELSRLVGLDFDIGLGIQVMERLGIEPHVRSPSGGFHAYVRHPGWHVPTLNSKVNHELPSGVDVRGDGGLLVLPPTVTDTGAYLRLTAKKLLQPYDLPDSITLPTHTGEQVYPLREVLGLTFAPQLQPAGNQVAATAPVFAERDERVDYRKVVDSALSLLEFRGRNEAGFSLACQLRDNQYSLQEVMEIGPYWISLLPGVNTKGQTEAYAPEHFRASVRSAFKQAPRRPWEKHNKRSG